MCTYVFYRRILLKLLDYSCLMIRMNHNTLTRRKSRIVAGEHGGITQHIGAFSVTLGRFKKKIFFQCFGHNCFLV
jgi:hypothetical protein